MPDADIDAPVRTWRGTCREQDCGWWIEGNQSSVEEVNAAWLVHMRTCHDIPFVKVRQTQLEAALVQCCEAGQVAYPDPCPWHGKGNDANDAITPPSG